jgi:hypothetical protein
MNAQHMKKSCADFLFLDVLDMLVCKKIHATGAIGIGGAFY